MQRELKFKDTALTDLVIASTGAVAGLNLIDEGVGASERTGRSIRISKVCWRWRLENPDPAGVDDSCEVVRIMLMVDHQANGALPAVTDVLASANFQAFRNLFNEGRFDVIMDRSIALNNHGGADGCYRFVGYFSTECDIVVDFSGTAGGIADVSSNNVICLIISESGLAGLVSISRVMYTDN